MKFPEKTETIVNNIKAMKELLDSYESGEKFYDCPLCDSAGEEVYNTSARDRIRINNCGSVCSVCVWVWMTGRSCPRVVWSWKNKPGIYERQIRARIRGLGKWIALCEAEVERRKNNGHTAK